MLFKDIDKRERDIDIEHVEKIIRETNNNLDDNPAVEQDFVNSNRRLKLVSTAIIYAIDIDNNQMKSYIEKEPEDIKQIKIASNIHQAAMISHIIQEYTNGGYIIE
jgi:hypothetical protein